MKNAEIAGMFEEMADLMEILNEDAFRVNSYRKAARAIQDFPRPIEDAAAAGELEDIPSVGKSTAAKIDQYLKTGKIDRREELLAKVPKTLQELLSLPGLGPKTVAKLWREAGITTLAALEHALDKEPQKLMAMQGMGAKKMRQIWESIQFVRNVGGRMRLGEADAVAGRLVELVSGLDGAGNVIAAGSLRRGKETVGDIDLVCTAGEADAKKIVSAFTSAPGVKRVLASGATKGSVVLDHDVQADLRVVEKASYGAALMYFTGSKDHNVHLRELAVKMGLKLNEYGLFKGEKRIAGSTEKEIYAALKLPFIPPELRENGGEIEAASKGKLPKLVELSDIKGDLHMHTVASDGANTIEELIEACQARGYQYMGITEHSKGQVQANGLDEERLLDHAAAIRKIAKKYPGIAVWVGTEVDIHKDGRLDYGDELLAELDFVIASPHSALGLSGPEATQRFIRAIENPRVTCIGHPTGRLINSRPGMEIDIRAVAKAAAGCGVALEINAHYMRLDLRDIHVREAIGAGARIIINTDTHHLDELNMMRYGVITARRGWATAADVINTFPVASMRKWLSTRSH